MVGKYLSKLESGNFIDELVNKPTPKCSSFYWNNYYKYKVFIPTKNRLIYFNMEEYNARDKINTNLEFGKQWRLATKNVCLAVGKNEIDKKILRKIKELKICLSNKRRQLRLKNAKNDQFSIPLESCKYYVLLVYDVKDIEHVNDKDRYKYATFCERIWLSDDEDQELIDLFDTTFEVIAKRFSNDLKRKVFCYNRAIY
ncbi:uncharacterized protein LOC132948829 [Metopolophium dirhodum]|uniref:uncharacterized protein LOC132948829 n=1 Tax=Metopolophium dirhodum TaxID=44670 RepID=UPI0029904720|nr:uncharacterized protein LOC132948829 [Metopolophium dirhodum]XP_060875469.1 uncharacterized protein LOC132948829 [Metopolophium dirhodum]XP_060875470.1 uncharacterized protein LOC132948829 [Metopolophium dirhodum]